MLKRITIALCVALSLLAWPQRGATEELPIPPTLEQHVARIFGPQAKIALAVFKHESHGLKIDAKNYNCFYYRENGKRYSTTCKTVKDRAYAWSVDCGLAQVNVRGKVCPPELMNLEGNMLAVERIYKEQGLRAWVSYTSGAYKAFLNKT